MSREKYQQYVKRDVTEHPLRAYPKFTLPKKSEAAELQQHKKEIDAGDEKIQPDDDVLYIPPFMLKHESTVEAIAYDKYKEKLLGTKAYDQHSGPVTGSYKIELFLNQQQIDISAYIKFCAENPNIDDKCQLTNNVHTRLVSHSQFQPFSADSVNFTLISNMVMDKRTMTIAEQFDDRHNKINKNLYWKRHSQTHALFPILPKNIETFPWDDISLLEYPQPRPLVLEEPFALFAQMFQFTGQRDRKQWFNLLLCGKQTEYSEIKFMDKLIWNVSPSFQRTMQPLIYHDVAASMTLQRTILKAVSALPSTLQELQDEKLELNQLIKKVEAKVNKIKTFLSGIINQISSLFTRKAKLPLLKQQKLQQEEELMKAENKLSQRQEMLTRNETDMVKTVARSDRLQTLKRSIWWTIDAFLCSVESIKEQCNSPFEIQVLPIKEALSLCKPWGTFVKDSSLSLESRSLQSLIRVCEFVNNMQVECNVAGIGPFIHGCLTRDNCSWAGDGIKVGNFSRTYITSCKPLLSKNNAWSKAYIERGYFSNYDETCLDFTCHYTYTFDDKRRENYSRLTRWFDIFTFINSMRDNCGLLDICKSWNGFSDPVIQDLLTFDKTNSKDFMRNKISSYANIHLQSLNKDATSIADFIEHLKTQASAKNSKCSQQLLLEEEKKEMSWYHN